MPSKYDEAALRRPDFDARGYEVTLADGQRWRMPAIRMRIFPCVDFQGAEQVMFRPYYAGELERELDILFGVTDSGYFERTEAEVKIAWNLLRRNYDLPAAAGADLLAYFPGDPASESMWNAIRSAILGRDPDAKYEPDGVDGDPKEPTPDGSS